MNFTQRNLKKMILGTSRTLTKVEETVCDTTRWFVYFNVIFKDEVTKKFYQTSYCKGATERLKNDLIIDKGDASVKCQEIRQVERVIKVWEKVE